MRLLTKTTLYFLAALVPLLIAAGIFLYVQFSKELNGRMDQELVTEEIQWIRYLQSQADQGITFILSTPEISINPVNAEVTKYPLFETITGFDANENRQLPFRQLTHVTEIRGIPYLISIRRSQEQRTVLVANITRSMLFVFLSLLIVTIIINWLISRSVWKPFKQSLNSISNTDLQKLEAIHFEATGIKEFNELNASLNEMVRKIYRDYINMKEFTENAAHEMQTPVAIVQGKLELLLQDENLKDEQVDSLMQASEALTRLSKLNQSLLLLTKIENKQYESTERINLGDITKKYLRLFDEHIKNLDLKVETKFTEEWPVNIHPFLADSLISNLIGNAIKYNYRGGEIAIEIRMNYFSVSNTSSVPPIDPELIFKRFNKTKVENSTSTGLGLAIVKKICDSNNLSIHYNATDPVHNFIIKKAT